MGQIDKILDILQEFLSRLTAKRLAAFALYLIYMAYLFWIVAGKKSVNTMDVITLEVIAFVGLPTVCFLSLIWALTWKGGGDEMISPPDKPVDSQGTE